MPQETKVKPDLNSPTGAPSKPSLAGASVDLADPAMSPDSIMDILDKAFDFRGDVTLSLSNSPPVSGYLFDRKRAPSLADSYLRLIPDQPTADKLRIPYSTIRRIDFSPRDPAAGKSFETWVKKYIEKKLKGETASIESESLD